MKTLDSLITQTKLSATMSKSAFEFFNSVECIRKKFDLSNQEKKKILDYIGEIKFIKRDFE